MPAIRVAVIASNIVTWVRDTAGVINRLLSKTEAMQATLDTAVLKDGATIYAGDTAGGSYDQTKQQAMMDAIKALSDRLKG